MLAAIIRGMIPGVRADPSLPTTTIPLSRPTPRFELSDVELKCHIAPSCTGEPCPRCGKPSNPNLKSEPMLVCPWCEWIWSDDP